MVIERMLDACARCKPVAAVHHTPGPHPLPVGACAHVHACCTCVRTRTILTSTMYVHGACMHVHVHACARTILTSTNSSKMTARNRLTTKKPPARREVGPHRAQGWCGREGASHARGRRRLPEIASEHESRMGLHEDIIIASPPPGGWGDCGFKL